MANSTPFSKAEVLKTAKQAVDNRIAQLEHDLASARESVNTATKSSVGDKHETSRAMLQQELVKIGAQLTDYTQYRYLLSTVDGHQRADVVGNGSLVQTEKLTAFIGPPIGKLVVNGQVVFCISTASPLGQAMLGVKEGETFSFRGMPERIVRLG